MNNTVKINSASVDLDPHNEWVTEDLERTLEIYKKAVSKMVRDTTSHGFASVVDAAEYGVRASARIKVLEEIMWKMVNGELHSHVDNDRDYLISKLNDRSWKQAPIVEMTAKWEDIRDVKP